MALVLVFSLAACGQKTEEAVNDDNMEKTEEPMETTETNDSGSTSTDTEDEDSTESDDSDDDSMTDDDSDDDPVNDDDSMESKTFTLEQLAVFNGKDGNPAYIAVNGVVYDVSDVGAWPKGKHQGFEAGKDVTDQINEISPHGTGVLESLPVVGNLAE